MKKIIKIISLLLAFGTLGLSAACFASTTDNIALIINGGKIETSAYTGKPYIDTQTQRTMVPIRIVSENLGFKVDWDQAKQEVNIANGDNALTLKIGSKNATVNGKGQTLESPATISNNRTYVPMRFVSENLGAKVKYVNSPKSVIVTTDGSEPALPTKLGKLEGNATGNVTEDLKKINDYFGEYGSSRYSPVMAGFNPLQNGQFPFFYVSAYNKDIDGDRPYEVEVAIKQWYTPTDADLPTADILQENNIAVKEVLRFYLPNGYQKLYKFLDDGFNYKLSNKTDYYMNKDIQNIIGSDGREVVIVDGNKSLNIQIGSKKK